MNDKQNKKDDELIFFFIYFVLQWRDLGPFNVN